MGVLTHVLCGRPFVIEFACVGQDTALLKLAKNAKMGENRPKKGSVEQKIIITATSFGQLG